MIHGSPLRKKRFGMVYNYLWSLDSRLTRPLSKKSFNPKNQGPCVLVFFSKNCSDLLTVAINKLLCMKNTGAQIAMDFS